MVTRLKNLSTRRAYTALGVLLAAFALPVLATTFNLFGPVNGILKGNANSPQTSAATSADVIGLWTGTCNGSSALKGDGSCGTLAAGTVSSVGLTMPTGFSVSGSPVTTSGTLGVTTALNGPLRGNGSGFITGNTSLTTEVSGVLPVANGGIGVGTLTGLALGNGTSPFTAAASSNVISLWSGTCNGSSFLRGDGACASPGGGGTVTSVGSGTGVTASPNPIVGAGTLAIDQAFTPTWTGLHTHAANIVPSGSRDLGTSAARWVNVFGTSFCDGACASAGLVGSSSTQAQLAAGSSWTTVASPTKDLIVGGTSVGVLSGAGRGVVTVNGVTDSGVELDTGGVANGYIYGSTSEMRLWGNTSRPLTFYSNAALAATIATNGGLFMNGATGGTQGAGTINAQGLFVNGVAVGGVTTATTTFTLGGCSAGTTGTINFNKIGKIVQAFWQNRSCTSTGGTQLLMAFTYPVGYEPSVNAVQGVQVITNNNIEVLGKVIYSTSTCGGGVCFQVVPSTAFTGTVANYGVGNGVWATGSYVTN